MLARSLITALTSAGVIVAAVGCATSSVSQAKTSNPSTPVSAAASTPSAQPSPAAGPQSACDVLSGKVDADHSCHVHAETKTYTYDFALPVDYPDQQALIGAVVQERDSFTDWVAQTATHPYRYKLDILGQTYHSGSPSSGTTSLVLTVGSDVGIHPVTSFRSLNYNLAERAPITFDTLFRPGTRPLDVLNPIVEREIDKHGGPGSLSTSDLDAQAYRSFAITDDAVLFFFDQDGLLPHTAGPLTVTVARSDIAPLLA